MVDKRKVIEALRKDFQAGRVLMKANLSTSLYAKYGTPILLGFDSAVAHEALVTPEMIAAASEECGPDRPAHYEKVYRTMAALAPDSHALQHELDTANAQVRLREGTIERQHRAMLEAQEREIALRAELMAAHDAMAVFTAANVSDSPSPARRNPFREFPRDMRRMGP